MAESIKDGTGDNKLAKVDDTNRLWTRAIAESPAHEATVLADHYFLSGGRHTLTDATKSAMIYIQTDELNDLFIDRIIVSSSDSTGSSIDNYVLSGIRNPTGMSSGTGNAIGIINTNFGSTKTLDITSEQGQQGASTTGGDTIFLGNFKEGDTHFISQRLLLQKGNSIMFEITPATGNTSQEFAIAVSCHLVKE